MANGVNEKLARIVGTRGRFTNLFQHGVTTTIQEIAKSFCVHSRESQSTRCREREVYDLDFAHLPGGIRIWLQQLLQPSAIPRHLAGAGGNPHSEVIGPAGGNPPGGLGRFGYPPTPG